MKQNNLYKGLLFALITSVISGFSIFYSKISVSKIDPLVLTTARNLIVGAVFFAGILLFGKISEIRKLSKKDLFKLATIGIIGGGIPFYLFFTGLQSIGAQQANIFHKSLFIWVSILAMIFLGERLSLISLIAYIMVFAGTYFFTPIKFVLGQGAFMVIMATFLWAIENIIAKKVLKSVSSHTVGLFRMGIGSVVLLMFTVLNNKVSLLIHLNMNQIFTIIVGSSLLCGYVYFWYKSLKFAPVNLVTLVLTFSVVVGNVLNGSLAGIRLSTKDIFSSFVLGSGVSIILIKHLDLVTYFKTRILKLHLKS